MSTESYYDILEVDKSASQEEIRKAFRRLSLIHHPDKNANSVESLKKTQQINEAFEMLGDINKRRQYDMTLSNPFIRMMGNVGENHVNMTMNEADINDLLGSLFGAGLGGGLRDFAERASPFVHVFGSVNGQPINFGRMNSFVSKPSAIVKEVVVQLEQILNDITMPVSIERYVVENSVKSFEKDTLYVVVPKGIESDTTIVVSEKGNIMNGCRGDVKVIVKVQNTTEFRRDCLDLHYEKTISLKEALCGFNFQMKYLNGRTYTIKGGIGHVISDGYEKVIQGIGLKRNDMSGNLIIHFKVKFPDKLSEGVVMKLKEIDF